MLLILLHNTSKKAKAGVGVVGSTSEGSIILRKPKKASLEFSPQRRCRIRPYLVPDRSKLGHELKRVLTGVAESRLEERVAFSYV